MSTGRSILYDQHAVSMTHCHVEGVPIGQHTLVTQMIKGVYNSRPPRPRYSAIWDVDSVIRYLASLEEDNVLSLKTLAKSENCFARVTSGSFKDF